MITRTILSFEMGLLWPEFTATFGSVFGLGFAIEGSSFFVEATFIGIYVYGWARSSPRPHLHRGIPVEIARFSSLMVISLNAWMQHPTGFRLSDGKVVDVDPRGALSGAASCGTSWSTCISRATSSSVSWWRGRKRSAGCGGIGDATSAPRLRCR
ncbi:MAG: cytochrome ubiquinol oxidase subunit I [Solirubrobacteraceae bacterium]